MWPDALRKSGMKKSSAERFRDWGLVFESMVQIAGVVHGFLSGWPVGGSVTFQKGFPYSIFAEDRFGS
jgi:hypothetical protein